MIEAPIPKDITKIKTVTIGPFTTRQVVCGSIAAVVEFIVFSILSTFDISMIIDTKVGLGVIIAVPIMIFAFDGPYGMPMEKFLLNTFILSFIAPTVRKYETKNIFCQEVDEDKTQHKERKFSNAELRKHPDYIMYE